MSSNILCWEQARLDVGEKEKELREAISSARVFEVLLFREITDGKYTINQIISIGTDFEYRIMEVYVHKMYLGFPDNKTPSYKGLVKAIRVKKGTNEVISGKYDSVAYSQEIYTNRIKQVLRAY